MKNFHIILSFLLFYYGSGYTQDTSMNMQHSSDTGHLMLNKADIKWMEGPPGLPAGAKFAVLAGDPSKEGPFTIRAVLPANYKIPAHWHPTTENLAVLEGTLYMGSGEKLDEKSAKELSPGGFSSIPPKSPHFVFTKSTCTIQVHAIGPFAITYINPEDDPRKKGQEQ